MSLTSTDKIKNLPTEEILLITTEMQLATSNSINYNSTGPDDIKIRYLKHLGSLAIKYLTKMYSTALNTNTIPHFGNVPPPFSFQNQTRTTTLAQPTNIKIF